MKAPPRAPARAVVMPQNKLWLRRQDMTARLVEMNAEAHRLGLHRTGHALHAAVQALGWEQADLLLQQRTPLPKPRRKR